MNIHLPSRCTRDLPPTKDIENVLTAFCTKTKLNPLGLTINVSGGDWDHRISKIGVRVVGFNDNNPHSVQVLIGCENNSVRGYITYRENDKGIRASELYSRISRLFQGNEKFISTGTDEEKKVAVAPEPAPVEAEVPAPAAAEETPPAETQEADKNGSPVSYKNFFDSEANLHLGVWALTLVFPTTSKVFSFKEFAAVLRKEVGIDTEDMKMASMAGRFTHEGYMIRRNVSPAPARYTLTEKAFAFAKQTPKQEEPAKAKARTVRREKPAAEKPVAPKAPEPPKGPAGVAAMPIGDLIAKFTELQRSENEYQGLLAEIEKCNRRLSGFTLPKLAEEDAALVKEITTLEERLAKLKKRREEISGIGARAHMAQTEINAFEETIRKNGLLEKHRRFKEMEAQLNQLQVLLKKSP